MTYNPNASKKYRDTLSPERKEERRKQNLECYYRRREENLPRMKAYSKKRYAEDRRRSLLYGAARRAKLDGLPFDITIEDIIIPDVCPVLGIPIIVGGKANDPHLPSLDKFVPSLGYVPSNITVISLRANSIKKNASIEEVRKLLHWMETKVPSPS